MKLQRWSIDAVWSAVSSSLAYMQGIAATKDGDGLWCEAKDVAALEAENAALRAEIERLKSPPKLVPHGEVIEGVFYWWREDENSEWEIMMIYGEKTGQFIGPLTPPEV